MEKLHVTLAAKAGFVELLKGRIAAKKASFDRERNDFEARLAEAK